MGSNWVEVETGRWLNFSELVEVQHVKRGDEIYWVVAEDRLHNKYPILQLDSKEKALDYIDRLMTRVIA